jgi:hypothetical protein
MGRQIYQHRIKTEKMILIAGQVILVLMIVSIAFGFVFINFLFELIRKKICNAGKQLKSIELIRKKTSNP